MNTDPTDTPATREQIQDLTAPATPTTTASKTLDKPQEAAQKTDWAMYFYTHHSLFATLSSLAYTALTLVLVIGALLQLRLLVTQQQNAVVLQLWQNWDSTLDINETRTHVSRFTEWQEAAKVDDAVRTEWIENFVRGDVIHNTDQSGRILNAPPEIVSAFGNNNGTMSRDDIEKIRHSLTRFLNMLEQGCIAYEYGFGNKEVMERAMKPQHEHYGESFRDYIRARQAGVPGLKAQPQAWMPILEFLDNSNPEAKAGTNAKALSPTRPSASSSERLDRLYDYTKWHMGVYVSCIGFLSAIVAGAAQSGPGGLRWLAALAGSPRSVLASIVLVAFAAASGGIVATTCIQCDNMNDFAASSFFFPSEWWTYMEHVCFWLACTAFAWSIYSSNTIKAWLDEGGKKMPSVRDRDSEASIVAQ